MQRRSIGQRIRLSIKIVLVLTLLLTGCEQQQKQRTEQVARPPEVAVSQIRPRTLVLTTELPGRTMAFRTAEIRPQVSGLLQKRAFTEGAAVEKGQLLYRIDPAPFEAALDNARASLLAMETSVKRQRSVLEAASADMARQEATLNLARTNMKRFETLFSKNAVSAAQRDQAVTDAKAAEEAYRAARAQVESSRNGIAEAEAGVERSRAAVKTAQINLSYTAINAPIAGRIGRSAVTEGAIVTAYQPLAMATIQQTDPMYVDVPQSTTQVLALRKRLEQGRLRQDSATQDRVSLMFEDGSAYPLEGRLEFQDITVDPSTGSVILRAVFPNPDHLLLPGMFVRAVIREGINETAILIPQQAVSRDSRGNPTVLILSGGNKVVSKQIGIDRAVKDQWLVSGGLEEGDRLIVDGLQKIRPGMTVTSLEQTATGAGSSAAGTPGAAKTAKPSSGGN